MKYAPPQFKSRRPKSVNYLEGFWYNLVSDIIRGATNTIRRKDYRSFFKGRFSFLQALPLSWRRAPRVRIEWVIIALLLGLLIARGGGSGQVIHRVQPAPARLSLKPLPILQEASQKPQDGLELVWVSKLRPSGTYANTYAPGNCTDGVASRLPIPNDWGNANNWAYAASLAGYTVTRTPAAESIAQTGGDSYLGHVAVVLSVNPDGSFVIWEENDNGLFSTDTRTTTTAEFPNFIIVQ